MEGSWANIVLAVVLIMLSGLFSGLNLGLMSLTEDDLRLIINGSDTPTEVRHAKRLIPLRKRGNLLLCTLLLGNTLVNAMIAILLDGLSGSPIIGPLSTGALVTTGTIVVFGEIVPQSVCSRHALAIGAASTPIVYFFMVLCFPIAWPVAQLLDHVLGREVSGVFSRHGLLALVKLNVESELHASQSQLSRTDAHLLVGALTFQDRSVGEVMTGIRNCFALSSDATLDQATIMDVLSCGHTRIPVYEGEITNIVALLFAKDLVGIGFERALPLSTVLEAFKATLRVHRVPSTMKCNKALDTCKRERCHLLVVYDAAPRAEESGDVDGGARGSSTARGREAVGIVTMEDFLEEILGEEIVDETDLYVDNTQHADGSVHEGKHGLKAHGAELPHQGVGKLSFGREPTRKVSLAHSARAGAQSDRAAEPFGTAVTLSPESVGSKSSGSPGSPDGEGRPAEWGREGAAAAPAPLLNSHRYDATKLIASLEGGPPAPADGGAEGTAHVQPFQPLTDLWARGTASFQATRANSRGRIASRSGALSAKASSKPRGTAPHRV